MASVNIGLNDEMTEILEIESNLGGGMNFKYCYEEKMIPKEFEFSIMDISSLQDVMSVIQAHVDNNQVGEVGNQ